MRSLWKQSNLSKAQLYDFGDNWKFEVVLERIEPVNPKIRAPKVMESHGEAPEQYPSWDE